MNAHESGYHGPLLGQPTTGSGQYLHRLVQALTAMPDVALMLIADSEAAGRAAPPPGVTWKVASTPFDGRAPGLAKLWFEQVAAPRLAARLGVDLLHVPYFAPPIRAAVPVVATIHDLIPLIVPAYRGSTLVRGYTALAARAAHNSAHVVADSDASRRDIVRHLRLPSERVSTVYLAADERFRPQPADLVNDLRARLDLPDRFVLYLGGFDVRKNVPLLLEALSLSDGSWPLVIAGRLPAQDTPFTPDPRRVATQLGLSERVRFVGWVEEADKPALMAAASLFAFPSSYEGFGLPVLEALASGTATVTTDVSSLPEIAGSAARLVPPGDAPALRDALDDLMASDAARRALADAGPEQAAHFSWARCATETRTVYEHVIAARRGSG